MMYESDEEANKIDLMFEIPTEKRNGATFSIPVVYHDYSSFVEKIKQQLAYFESVYFNVRNIDNNTIKIYRDEHFQYSSLNEDTDMHICLDNVYYPIDWNKLGISPIRIPIGLRFSLIDGIFPIPNRESLKYTEDAKNIILNKIKTVANSLVNKYNSELNELEDVNNLISFYRNNKRILNLENISLEIGGIAKYSSITLKNPVLKGVKLLDWPDLVRKLDFFVSEYSIRYRSNYGTINGIKQEYAQIIRYDDINYKNFMLFTELKGLKKTYIKHLYPQKTIYFIKKHKSLPLGKLSDRYTYNSSYITFLQLWKYPKSEWRERIKEAQYIQSLILANIPSVDDIEIPQEWLDERKKKRLAVLAANKAKRAKKLEGEMVGKVAAPLQRYVSGKYCKFIPQNINMTNAHRYNIVTIYGLEKEEEDRFQQLYGIFGAKVRLVLLSSREIKKFNEIELHNWIEINKFMEGKNMLFKRAVTAAIINNLIERNTAVFEHLEYIKNISTPLYDKMEKLKEYVRLNEAYASSNLLTAMIELAEEHKLFDYSIYSTYKEVEGILNKLTFLKPILSSSTRYYRGIDQELIPVLRDLFKYYRQKMDWQHYMLPINEEEVPFI